MYFAFIFKAPYKHPRLDASAVPSIFHNDVPIHSVNTIDHSSVVEVNIPMDNLPDAEKLLNMDPECSAFESVDEQISYIQSMCTLLYFKQRKTLNKH